MTQHTTKPSTSRAAHGWRRYLLLAALTCMVGLYSLQVTHFHSSTKHSLEYPKSQVERPALHDTVLPDLTATLDFCALYHFTATDSGRCFIHRTLRFKPPGRAPPSRYS